MAAPVALRVPERGVRRRIITSCGRCLPLCLLQNLHVISCFFASVRGESFFFSRSLLANPVKTKRRKLPSGT